MPSKLLRRTEGCFDSLQRRWEKLTSQRRVASALVIVFVAGLVLVEA